MADQPEPKRAREEYAEEAISDISDTELDAAILSKPSNTALPTASLEGGLFDDSPLDHSSSDSSDSDAPDRRLSALAKEDAVRARLAAANAAMLPLLSTLPPATAHRYETFRRVGFPRPFVKRLLQKAWGAAGGGSSTGGGVAAVIVVAGIAKVFVGELVETAREVATQWDGPHTTVLLPSHYREAYRRLVNAGRIKGNIHHRSLL